VVRHPGSDSAEFKRNRRAVLALSDICWLCLHPGAGQVDHVVPRRAGGGDEAANLMPAHGHDDRLGRSGIDYRCFTPPCNGTACNQSRKTKPGPPVYRSRDW
jgi:hypothetical protein